MNDISSLQPKTGILTVFLKVILEDFGILPYYVLKSISDRFQHPPRLEAKAYLTIPLHQTPIRSDMNDGSSRGWAVDSVVDSSVLEGLTETHLNGFREVRRLLRLHPFDSSEDEAAYIDQHGGHIHSGNNGDSYSALANREKDGIDDKELIDHSSQDDKMQYRYQIRQVKPELMILGTGVLG